MSQIELGENRNKEASKLFSAVGEVIDFDNLRRGYRNHLSWHYLRTEGSPEMHYEAQTFLPHDILEHFDVNVEVRQMQRDFVARRAAELRVQQHEAEAHAAAAMSEDLPPAADVPFEAEAELVESETQMLE